VPSAAAPAAPHTPKEIPVNAADSLGIQKALAAALPGDTIAVPQGEYLGPLELKDRVNIVAQSPHQVIVRSDPASPTDPGIAIAARDVKDARIKGLNVTGDDTHPLRIGLLIANSSIEAEDIEIATAIDSGLRIDGDSRPLIVGGNFHSNAGPGIVIHGESAPRLVGNRVAENGRIAGSPRAGVEIDNESQPTLLHNDILQNGLPAVFPPALDQEIRAKNSVDVAPAPKPRVPPAKPAVKPRLASHPLTEARLGRADVLVRARPPGRAEGEIAD
jgi:parallel beta-helix repeat protein